MNVQWGSTTTEVETNTSYNVHNVSVIHTAFRVNAMTWQQTASSGWKGQMWFASALSVPPFLPPSASLPQTFSHGLTLLHNQQQDRAQHITFIGNEREWANHSSYSLCTVSCGMMWAAKNVYFQLLLYERLRKSKREKNDQGQSKQFSLKVSLHPNYKKRLLLERCLAIKRLVLCTNGSVPTSNTDYTHSTYRNNYRTFQT